jgi:cold shock protein
VAALGGPARRHCLRRAATSGARIAHFRDAVDAGRTWRPGLPAATQALQCGQGAWSADVRERNRMPTGTVKWFNETKGFGFIKPDDGGADLFAHYSGIKSKGFRTLKENQRVEYQVQQGQKGPQAVEIDVIG